MTARNHKARMAAILALGLGTAQGAAAAPPPADPGLRLEWRESEGRVSVRVVTSGSRPLRLTYVLRLSGSSQSINSGNVEVRPGSEKVVSALELSPAEGWHAVLEVSGDQAYRVEAPQD